jgi:hypothetical protein
MKAIALALVAIGCGRVVPDASDASPEADACPIITYKPMPPARHENICTQTDIDVWVSCAPCVEMDGGPCAACLYTKQGDTTWGPQVPIPVGVADLISLPNTWGCIDILTNGTCGDALFARDMCLLGQCDRGVRPLGPCDVEYDADTCNADALAGACKPDDDVVRAPNGPCAGILAQDGGPLAVVAACFGTKGEIASVFCGP